MLSELHADEKITMQSPTPFRINAGGHNNSGIYGLSGLNGLEMYLKQ